MPCPLCGDICRCASDANSASAPGWLASDDAVAEPALPGGSPADPPAPGGSVPEDSPAWRQELADRLNRYQARRKPRPPRYPSLRLRFEDRDADRGAPGISDESPTFPHRMATASNQALALDGFADIAADAAEIPASEPRPLPEAQAVPEPAAAAATQATAPATAKIIEFPRSWT